MVSIEVIALVLTGIGLAASLVYYANILQNSSKARQRELIFQRGQVYNLEYSKAFSKVINMRDWNTPEARAILKKIQ